MGKEGLHPDSKQKKSFSMLSDEEVGHFGEGRQQFFPERRTKRGYGSWDVKYPEKASPRIAQPRCSTLIQFCKEGWVLTSDGKIKNRHKLAKGPSYGCSHTTGSMTIAWH
jgi:hypothetical protein